MQNRYTGQDNWYKGNTHVHTTLSDGGKSPKEVITLYKDASYDFLAITDHWHAYHTDETASEETEEASNILILDGIEIDGRDDEGHYYHVVALGDFPEFSQLDPLSKNMSVLIANNAYLILAHPYWSGNRMEDVRKFPFHAIEIYNHVAYSLNGKSHALPYWDDTLRSRTDLFGIAADDAHFIPAHPGWKGGWIMVQAPRLTKEAIMQSLRNGRFYSTTGPEFLSIRTQGNVVSCETSPICKAWLVGEGYIGNRVMASEGESISRFSFTIEPESSLARSPFLRIEIEDAFGKRAWTNSL